MSEMKMSDVFDLPVSFDVDLCKIYSPSHNLIEAKAISLDAQCYAINNHDRMMEEIAELRDFVRMVADADSASDEVKSFMVHSFVHNAKQLLAKLNQEEEK